MLGIIMSSSFTAGESGCPGSRGDQQEDAGPDASRVWRRPATDLHTDAQGLLPTIPFLQHLQVAHSRRLADLLGVLVPRRARTPPSIILLLTISPFLGFSKLLVPPQFLLLPTFIQLNLFLCIPSVFSLFPLKLPFLLFFWFSLAEFRRVSWRAFKY